jgi:hypothetical protein
VDLRSVKVYVNGAFFMGYALDTDMLVADGYQDRQELLRNKLREPSEDWHFTPILERPWFSSDEIYPTFAPIGFMTRRGPDLEGALQSALAVENVDGVSLSVESAAIDFFDFGVGVAAATIEATFASATSLGTARRHIDRMADAIQAAYNKIIGVGCKALEDGCKAVLADYFKGIPWCQSSEANGVSSGTPAPATAPNQLLWVHRTYMFDEGSMTDSVPTLDEIATLFPSTHERVDYRSFIFVPGISTSAIVPCLDLDPDDYIVKRSDVIAVMNLQWAILAALVEFDRTLFRRLNLFAAQGMRRGPRELDRETADVLALYEQVRLFQGYIDSVLIDRGAPMSDAWNGMGRIQGLGDVLTAVARKLDALQIACQVQMAESSAKRQRRLGITVDLFAIFSVVGAATGTAAFLFSTDIGGGILWRVVTTAGILASVLLVIAVRELLGRRP